MRKLKLKAQTTLKAGGLPASSPIVASEPDMKPDDEKELPVHISKDINTSTSPVKTHLADSGTSETTPLVQSSTDDEKRSDTKDEENGAEQRDRPLLARLGIPGEINEATAAESLRYVADRVIRTKETMRKSPWIVSIIVCVASLGLVWAGVFGVFSNVIRFQPFVAVLKVYQVFFSLLCFLVEVSRYVTAYGIRSTLRRWAPIFELNIGRGCLQLLTGGLGLGYCLGMIEWVPGLALGMTGVINCVWGIQCALRLRALMRSFEKELQRQSGEPGPGGESDGGSVGNNHSSPLDTLRYLRVKFKALDINGDGRLSREELAVGCKSLDLTLDEAEVDAIFRALDPRSKGYIDVTDLEEWWYREKNPIAAFLV